MDILCIAQYDLWKMILSKKIAGLISSLPVLRTNCQYNRLLRIKM